MRLTRLSQKLRWDDMDNNLMVYQSVITDIKNIINTGQQEAYGAASKAMVCLLYTSPSPRDTR